jgi:serine phosphatase RsbU (regulator of sigma subunit)
MMALHYHTMKLKKQTIVLVHILILLTACSTKDGRQVTDERETATSNGNRIVADSLMAQAMAASDASRMLALADSLEATGDFSSTAANYYRGGAYSILQKVVLADSCLRKATDNTNPAPQDRKVYLNARTLLAQNLLEKNFVAALHEALPLMAIIDSADFEASFSDKVRVTRVVASSQLHLEQESEADQTAEKLYGYIREWMDSDVTGHARHSILAHLFNVSSDYLDTKNFAKGTLWTQRADSVWHVFNTMRDSDRDDLDFFQGAIALNYARAYQGLGRTSEALAAYDAFKKSPFGSHPIGRINSTYYLLEAKRYNEAADNLTDLDQIIEDAGYDMSLDNIGSLMIPKLLANLGANRKDTALAVAARIAESFEQAFKDQKRGDAVEMAVVYDTQEKERSLHEQEQKIAEQDAKLFRTRLRAFSIGFVAVVLSLIFFMLYRHRQAKRLAEVKAAQERMEGELQIARNIQKSMVPSVFPEIDGLDMFASMTPAKEVGGDLYGYLILGDQLYFCIGDVSGKGVPASLFMAQATRLFHALASQGMTPAEICTAMNTELSGEDNEQGMFVTMFICRLNLKLNLFEYCNAGHNPPVLGNDDGQFSFLDMEPNAPIGLWPGLEYVGESIGYFKDRLLFLYTDGLNEAEDNGQHQFGDDRLLDILRQNRFHSARQVIEIMTREVERHRNGAEPNDDLTMLCLRIS